MDDIEKTEAYTRQRAVILGLMGIVLLAGGALAWRGGAAADTGIAFGVPVWSLHLLLTGLAALLIATGGGLRMPSRILALANDETTRAYRTRGIVAGFWAMLATVTGAYVLSFFGEPWPMRVLARVLADVGEATALLVFAWAELRAARD